MAPKKTVTAMRGNDPRRPYEEITIGDQAYKMSFTYDALAEGEARLLAKGYVANLLFRLPWLNFGNLRIIFAVSLVEYHPEVDFNEAVQWVNDENMMTIYLALRRAWNKAMPVTEASDNPPQPAP